MTAKLVGVTMNCPVCHHELTAPLPPEPAEHWQAIRGNNHAKRATEIALAGPHSIGFIGHPENGREQFVGVLGDLARWVAPCGWGYFRNPMRECVCRVKELAAWRQTVEYRAVTACDLIIDVVPPRARDMLSDRPSEALSEAYARIKRAIALRADAASSLDRPSLALLEHAITRLGFSATRVAQVRTVALTIATLDGYTAIQSHHIAEAIQYAFVQEIQ